MKLIQFVKYLLLHYPKRIPALLILLTISGLLESIGVGAVIPVLEFFFNSQSASETSVISLFFYDILHGLNLSVSLRSLFGLIIGLFALKSAIAFIQHWFLEYIVSYFYTKKSNELMAFIMNAEWSYTQRQRIGELHNLFAIEMDKFVSAIRSSIQVLTEMVLFLFYLSLSCWISVKLTGIMILLLAIALFPIKILNAYIHLFSERTIKSRESLYNLLQQLLSGVKFIKGAGYIQKSQAIFEEKTEKTAWLGYRTGILVGILPSFFILFSIISLSSIAFLSLSVFHLPFSYFLLITIIFYRLYPKFQGMQLMYQHFIKNSPSIDVIVNAITAFQSVEEQGGHHLFTGLKQYIQFKNVNFNYGKEMSFSVRDLNLTIKGNEFMGIVGPSGCGKTTVIDLLTGLFKPTTGTIMIDGRLFSDYNLTQLRQNIGLVSQDTFLFNESIRNNLTWGQDHFTSDAIILACRQANMDTFIDTLPDGIDTVIGERGLQLSGGQRQRLSLARALLKKPSILILDEATSALDAESESEIQNSIYALKGQITLIIISHRLATVKQADRIIVMDKGAIIQEGSWDQLSQQEGLFKRFKALQILS